MISCARVLVCPCARVLVCPCARLPVCPCARAIGVPRYVGQDCFRTQSSTKTGLESSVRAITPITPLCLVLQICLVFLISPLVFCARCYGLWSCPCSSLPLTAHCFIPSFLVHSAICVRLRCPVSQCTVSTHHAHRFHLSHVGPVRASSNSFLSKAFTQPKLRLVSHTLSTSAACQNDRCLRVSIESLIRLSSRL